MKIRLARKVLSANNFAIYRTKGDPETSNMFPFYRCRRYKGLVPQAFSRLGLENFLDKIDEHNAKAEALRPKAEKDDKTYTREEVLEMIADGEDIIVLGMEQ